MKRQARRTAQKRRPISTVNTVAPDEIAFFNGISDDAEVGEKTKLLNGNYRELRLISRH